MPDVDSLKGEKPPELRVSRFIIAIAVCFLEMAACVAACLAVKWERADGVVEILISPFSLLFSLAVLGGIRMVLGSTRFILAITVCLFIGAVYAVVCFALDLERADGVLALLFVLAVLGGTWTVLGRTWTLITGEKFRETLTTKPFRKFGQGSLYNQGFTAGRDGESWEELAPELREQSDFFRGYQDGLSYRSLKERSVVKDEG